MTEDLQHIIDRINPVLINFRHARIFITGGTGFFGSWLLETFAYANQSINLDVRAVVLTRNPEAFKIKAPHLVEHSNFTFLTGDVRSFNFPEGKFTHVFHLATEASDQLNKDNPEEMLDVIVTGTRHTLEFALKAQASTFLLVSSGAIYGKQPENLEFIPENFRAVQDENTPYSAYAAGKMQAESLARQYATHSNLQVKIARCFAFVGPCMKLNQHFAAGNFILNMLENRNIIIQGDGTPVRSYMYASDLMVWLLTVCESGIHGKPYNVGSMIPVTIRDLAEIVKSCSPNANRIIVKGTPDKNKPQERYVPDTTRAEKELGLKLFTDIHTAFQKTIRYYLQTRQ